jgi:hypothetical protein
MHCCRPRAYFGCTLDLQGALAEVGVLNAQAQLSAPPYQQESIFILLRLLKDPFESATTKHRKVFLGLKKLKEDV